MTKRQADQYRMFVRVQKFGDAYKEKFPEGSEAAKAFAVLNEAVDELKAFDQMKATAKRVSKREKRAAKLALGSHRRHRTLGARARENGAGRRGELSAADAPR